VAGLIRHTDGDVRDLPALLRVFGEHRPEIVFHLAAQPLVPVAYTRPVETFEINVLGSVHVLEAVRQTAQVAAVVMVTSDKCYQNREWVWGYRETDQLGGDDPYSASKAAAELAIAAYRHSIERVWPHSSAPAIASARAGNVIGGGDWSADRLIPDLVRAVAREEPVRLRKPTATRPWQHVLEPLSGYLWLARKLATGDPLYRSAWNFAPSAEVSVQVQDLATRFLACWDGTSSSLLMPDDEEAAGKESTLLRLNADKALHQLGWRTNWSTDETVAATAEWYRAHVSRPDDNLAELSRRQIARYVEQARANLISWAS
jgi:CDP-glucose 4,6-dehydratase